MMMFEYILFDEKPFQLFMLYLADKGIDAETEIDEGESYEIKIADDIDDDLLDAIEIKYEALMDMNQQIVNDEEKTNDVNYHMAALVVTLSNGEVSYADIDPDVMARIISIITPQELGDMVNSIADAVENPQPKSYCQRMRETESKKI